MPLCSGAGLCRSSSSSIDSTEKKKKKRGKIEITAPIKDDDSVQYWRNYLWKRRWRWRGVEYKDEERDKEREVAEEEKLRPESSPRNSIGLSRSLCIVSQSPIKRIVWNQSLIFVSPCPL